MSELKAVPVILCGGSGTRLWPRSRASRPKPFLPLIGSKTLFRQALERCENAGTFTSPLVVTAARLVDHVRSQLATDSEARLIVEPQPKNTAAAIALAAHSLPSDAIMLVCPSDHYIGDVDSFVAAAATAVGMADDGWLVSLAVKPTRPEVGFGYLRQGPEVGQGFAVAEFVEKPDKDLAAVFLGSGDYFWNAGIFAFKVERFLAELEKHRPDLAASVSQAWEEGRWEGDSFYPDIDAFAGVRGESVDYAVMENAERVAMVPVDIDWSDIGNWQAVRDARGSDQDGNCVEGPVELVDCRNVMVDSDGPRVHVLGLDDAIIVVDGNDILVTKAARASDVGRLKGALNQ